MTRLAALLAALCAAATAFGGDGGIKSIVESALKSGDRATALAALDAVIAEGAPRSKTLSLDATDAALDLVGGPDGDVRAARILVDALKRGRDDKDVFEKAKAVSRRLWDVDLPAETELLRGLSEIYPEILDFANDLAVELRHAGLSDDALAEYQAIKANAPSDKNCRYELALLFEVRGDLDRSRAEYDDLIALHEADPQPDLKAHWMKSRLLLFTAHDLLAARAALEKGAAAAERAPPGQNRDWYVESFKSLVAELEQEERARRELRDLRGRLDRDLVVAVAAWLVVLGGGLASLRRAKWI